MFFYHSGLNNFLQTLDKRYADKIKGEGVLMAKKLRRPGCSSTLLPPAGAPSWTLDEAWKGNKYSLLSILFLTLYLFQVTPSRRVYGHFVNS